VTQRDGDMLNVDNESSQRQWRGGNQGRGSKKPKVQREEEK